MSLEGNLSRCRFADEVVTGHEETAVLRRSTLEPVYDFVVLRLTPETREQIFAQVMAAGLEDDAELEEGVIHLQIERSGVIELGAYDNFHRDCVATGPGIDALLLVRLKKEGILRDFCVANPPPFK